jgi:hypothetical protein
MAGGNYANFFWKKSPIGIGGFAISTGAGGLTGKRTVARGNGQSNSNGMGNGFNAESAEVAEEGWCWKACRAGEFRSLCDPTLCD